VLLLLLRQGWIVGHQVCMPLLLLLLVLLLLLPGCLLQGRLSVQLVMPACTQGDTTEREVSE
jgi:hypothetical protein